MSRNATYKFILSQKKNDDNQSVHRPLWLESYAAAASPGLCSEALETLTDFIVQYSSHYHSHSNELPAIEIAA
jgi:hypothetical protein